MINVNQITAQMARMSDQALQQFAAMHKADPYTLSLALSESNRRKELRQSAQMQQQPQPKVVDQEIAQMGPQMPLPQQGMPPQQLPEEIGIGRLPAPNMQRMATGGIVAFDEGGEVPRFQVGGGVLGDLPPGMTDSKAYAEALSKYKEGRPLSGVEKALLFTSKPLAAAADVALLPFTGLANALHNPLDKSPRPSITPVADARERALYGDQKATAPIAAAPTGGPDLVANAGAVAPAVPGGPPAPPPAAGGAPAGPGLPSIVKPRVPELAPEIKALDTKLPTASQAQGIAAQFLDEEKYAQQLKDFEKEEAAAIDARRAKLEKSLGEMPERYKDYEKRLKAQEKEDAGDKEKLTGMSFLEAGLAVLSGESPHAFVNLGRAKEGVKTYNEGIKDIKRSARERDKAFGDIENARQAQAEGKIDAMNRFEESAAKSMSDSKRFAMSGLQSLGMKGAEMSANAWNTATNNAYANQRAVADAAGRMQTADISGQYGLAAAQTHAAATIGAANIRAATDREYSNAFRLGQLNLATQKAIDDALAKWAKANHYTQDDPEYQIKRRELIREYTAANPNMAQSAGAPGGGGAPSDFVYKDGKLVPRN